ncbi:zinc finger and BTB domain-containing protein 37 [Chiloscyllium plagiosum]|uniref:zinc finger and BTB domain-containing protein 37 n=1 Tax=Chiloscyllium plagiosum TaxID=36176 RepID=UPI001CB7B045|nr:zinc finger and BTB domain-containing protein 37 [Chiloscyllium plagiosum]XP_043555969.1 zinc finger and BTB domain-containing protein 37 [Chiloscyllium plagiosum]XP_060686042.1 zinc finger and BTB domain-containing protein 37 [Hemiscyllium ocellatum]XP_060686043.1 zinc finger and BTB domain-containing protein 37 [Hemiscyllium ocellatum]XP_060686044.1 zinc finger and BTB domain-containing protein 37 [Hemiscyllium ocellatum]XP_060686045.1 zinc finger and BTB domain-containing protein 37 [Hem
MEKEGSIQLEVPDFSSSVLAQLNQLRMQGRLCDIVVDVQGKSFRAHKAVLAASSPYFRDHMSLGEMSAVSISVIKSPAVFERLLAFCYTGKLCLQVADIISYLTAASFLQMQYIIDKCTQILDGIHFRIDVSEVEAGLNQDGPKRPAQTRSIATPSSRRGRATSGFSRRSPLQDELGSSGADERLVRIDRVGQWYVETGVSGDHSPEAIRQIGGMRIKTETPDEWIMSENQPSGEDGSSAEEVTAMVIDSAGHSTLVQEAFPTAASSGKISRPSSSFSEMDRFSPSGSVVCTVPERHRARSESPGKNEERKQPNSQADETPLFGVSGYEEYLRDQEVAERWYRYNPRLTCLYCGKSFNQKGSLDRHMRLHMGITPFVCRICGKKYTRKDQLEYHIRKHTGNKPFHCHVCGKSFPFQAILNQHFKKNHPGCTLLEGLHSISPETTSKGQNGEESPPQDEAKAIGELIHTSVSTTGPD